MSNKKVEENYLDRIPNRNIEWETEENGKVILLKEKSKRKWMKKLIDFFNKSQVFRIHLDELGSSAWLLTDGNRSIHEISLKMREEFETKVEPAEQRVAAFFAMMQKNKFICFR